MCHQCSYTTWHVGEVLLDLFWLKTWLSRYWQGQRSRMPPVQLYHVSWEVLLDPFGLNSRLSRYLTHSKWKQNWTSWRRSQTRWKFWQLPTPKHKQEKQCCQYQQLGHSKQRLSIQGRQKKCVFSCFAFFLKPDLGRFGTPNSRRSHSRFGSGSWHFFGSGSGIGTPANAYSH
jgi:hypothetical protein